jgi:hypothetical protein
VKWWSWILDDERDPGNFLRWRVLIAALTVVWLLVLAGVAAIYRLIA